MEQSAAPSQPDLNTDDIKAEFLALLNTLSAFKSQITMISSQVKSLEKKVKKRMKALRVAKVDGATKEEKKAIRKKIRKELKEAGLDKEEIKTLIKENIKVDKEKRIVAKRITHQQFADIITRK